LHLLRRLTRRSGITIAQRALLVPALESLGAAFSPNLEERCTHIIVPSGCGSGIASSAKVVACSKDPLCRYVWIVTSAWLSACQAQRCHVAERQFLLQGTPPPTYVNADAWLASVARELPSVLAPHQMLLFGENGLVALPPSSLFLDDEPQEKQPARKGKQKRQQQQTPPPPSKTRGWWINESSAAHVTHPFAPLSYGRVTDLMSLSSSDPLPTSQQGELQPLDSPLEGLEDGVPASPPVAVKTVSMSPASSMSGSRTSQGKRKDPPSASDGVCAGADDVYCAVESLLDER
jgi:hypothetical protein